MHPTLLQWEHVHKATLFNCLQNTFGSISKLEKFVKSNFGNKKSQKGH
jgi:hypothetical protein